MFGLGDKWTRELAKLREKGQTIFSSGSSPAGATRVESGQVVQPQERGSNGLIQAFITRIKPANSPFLPYSEGSVSMLVDCFCP